VILSGTNPPWKENWKVRFGICRAKSNSLSGKKLVACSESISTRDSNPGLQGHGLRTIPLDHHRNLIAHNLKEGLPSLVEITSVGELFINYSPKKYENDNS
jgi:hypothetical protein